jgi:hypothetical protein
MFSFSGSMNLRALGWGLTPETEAKKFCEYLIGLCPAMEDARKIINGTKHFGLDKIATGAHQGAFDRRVFQANAFDVSYLWIDRNGKRQKAERFIQELVDFWREFSTSTS